MKIVNKPLIKSIIKDWTTYALLAWHVIIWLLLAKLVPDYWGWFLGLCSASYLFINSIFIYYRLKHSFKPQRSDSVINPAVQIANETSTLLRTGLNEQTAQKIAEIIQKISDVPALSITDRERTLAFLGPGCEHHPPGMPILTQTTLEVIRTGKLLVKKQSDFNCKRKDCHCPLESAVIAPLTIGEKIVGTVKLYQTEKVEVPSYLIKLAGGIASLLSMQMEISELERQSQLVTEAKLDALQAQINPHFLFNTLNTIGMLIRTKPDMARRLLHRLASFFRHSLKHSGRFVTLEEEIRNVKNYFILEKARFREKLRVVKKIEKELIGLKIPVLCIQPLVENAIKHGITPKEGKGTVQISVCRGDGGEIEVTVSDDGVGISPEIMPRVMEPGFGSGSGVGLSNVDERLKMIYGEGSGLRIWSEPGVGTTVKFIVPNR